MFNLTSIAVRAALRLRPQIFTAAALSLSAGCSSEDGTSIELTGPPAAGAGGASVTPAGTGGENAGGTAAAARYAVGHTIYFEAGPTSYLTVVSSLAEQSAPDPLNAP